MEAVRPVELMCGTCGHSFWSENALRILGTEDSLGVEIGPADRAFTEEEQGRRLSPDDERVEGYYGTCPECGEVGFDNDQSARLFVDMVEGWSAGAPRRPANDTRWEEIASALVHSAANVYDSREFRGLFRRRRWFGRATDPAFAELLVMNLFIGIAAICRSNHTRQDSKYYSDVLWEEFEKVLVSAFPVELVRKVEEIVDDRIPTYWLIHDAMARDEPPMNELDQLVAVLRPVLRRRVSADNVFTTMPLYSWFTNRLAFVVPAIMKIIEGTDSMESVPT